jgi:hypothetical protein
MTRERADIEASLLKKRFRKDDGDHHYYIYWNISGKKTIRKTMMSRGSSYRSVSDDLLAKMARQTGLTKQKFLELVDCPLDRSGYEKIAFPSLSSSNPSSPDEIEGKAKKSKKKGRR